MNTLNLLNDLLGTSFKDVEEVQEKLIKPEFLATLNNTQLYYPYFVNSFTRGTTNYTDKKVSVELIRYIGNTISDTKIKNEFIYSDTKLSLYKYLASLDCINTINYPTRDYDARYVRGILDHVASTTLVYIDYNQTRVLTDYANEQVEKYKDKESTTEGKVLGLEENLIYTYKKVDLVAIIASFAVPTFKEFTWLTVKQEETLMTYCKRYTEYYHNIYDDYQTSLEGYSRRSRCKVLLGVESLKVGNTFVNNLEEEVMTSINKHFKYNIDVDKKEIKYKLMLVLFTALISRDSVLLLKVSKLQEKFNTIR